jgi:hypothetical protein
MLILVRIDIIPVFAASADSMYSGVTGTFGAYSPWKVYKLYFQPFCSQMPATSSIRKHTSSWLNLQLEEFCTHVSYILIS